MSITRQVSVPGNVHAFQETPMSQSMTDTFAIKVLSNPALARKVRGIGKLDLNTLRDETLRLLTKVIAAGSLAPQTDSLHVHNIITKGLPAEALPISYSMLFDTSNEGDQFFNISPKTRAALTTHKRLLDPDRSQKAVRIASVLSAATAVFGDPAVSRDYLRTKNFALGGKTPLDLLRSPQGEQIVLTELAAQAEGGPL